jgi:outer membrane receptor protein involved in Fe transport
VTMFWSVDYKSGYFLDRANQSHKKYPGRTIHDAGISHQISGIKTGLTLQIKNITDQRTFDVIGMPKPGISYMMTADYKL